MQSKQQELTKSQVDVRGREERYQAAVGEAHWPRQAASVRRGPQVIHDTSVTYIWQLLRSRNISGCSSLKWLSAGHNEWIQNSEEKLGTSSQGWLSRMSAAETGLQAYRKEWHPGVMGSHNTYCATDRKSHAILSGLFWQFWDTHCCSGFSGLCARFCKSKKTLLHLVGLEWAAWVLMSMASHCWYLQTGRTFIRMEPRCSVSIISWWAQMGKGDEWEGRVPQELGRKIYAQWTRAEGLMEWQEGGHTTDPGRTWIIRESRQKGAEVMHRQEGQPELVHTDSWPWPCHLLLCPSAS